MGVAILSDQEKEIGSVWLICQVMREDLCQATIAERLGTVCVEKESRQKQSPMAIDEQLFAIAIGDRKSVV